MSEPIGQKRERKSARLLTSLVLCVGGAAWGFLATTNASSGKQLLATAAGAYLGLGLATAVLWLGSGIDETGCVIFLMLPFVWPLWPFMIRSLRRHQKVAAARDAATSERQQFLASPPGRRAIEQIRQAAAPGFPISGGPEAVAEAIARAIQPGEEILRCWLNAQRHGFWATTRGVYVQTVEGMTFFGRGTGATASAIDHRAIIQDTDGRRWAMVEYSESTGGGPIDIRSSTGQTAKSWLPGSTVGQAGMAARAAAEVAHYLAPDNSDTARQGTGRSSAEVPAAQASETVAAPGWYVDPAGRFELRYWDGTTWTEHVARGGAVFVDPVVD